MGDRNQGFSRREIAIRIAAMEGIDVFFEDAEDFIAARGEGALVEALRLALAHADDKAAPASPERGDRILRAADALITSASERGLTDGEAGQALAIALIRVCGSVYAARSLLGGG